MDKLRTALQKVSDPKRALVSQRFFKTGKGQYGEGDVFIGITVPQTRIISKQFLHMHLPEIKEYLHSKIHEERLAALFILVEQYNRHLVDRTKLFEFYMENKEAVNNWDLVDSSADRIVGRFLFDLGKDYPTYKILLTNLAKSSNVWERRIAIIASFYFIKQKEFKETFFLAELLLTDGHDLIHKAVGWMLREIGKRDRKAEEEFLKKHYKKMPRTMLRYAIEHFDQSKRKDYLEGNI